MKLPPKDYELAQANNFPTFTLSDEEEQELKQSLTPALFKHLHNLRTALVQKRLSHAPEPTQEGYYQFCIAEGRIHAEYALLNHLLTLGDTQDGLN